MKTLYLSILMLTTLSAFSQNTFLNKQTKLISLVELIANGEKHDEERLRVKGYFVDYGRQGRLFLHKDDALYGIYPNSIIIHYDAVECDFKELTGLSGNYILIEGFFNKHGSMIEPWLVQVFACSKLELRTK